ncbi:MAG TPA: NTP transferase domain-containing protein [Actinomycetales bacterium]|nr:NTP transferase domain-containing protein [Actinomycetales bacterium]
MTVSMIIGGGQSTRMGQDKSRLNFRGRTLLEHAVDALAFCDEILIVAPERELGGGAHWPAVRFTLEDPPHGGPVAGLAAGVAAWEELADAEHVVILPVDMPNPGRAAAWLDVEGRAALGPEVDGVVLEDEAGWPQYLLGRYRLGALRRAVAALGSTRNKSMRKFGELLNVARIPVENLTLIDVDTPEDARAHGIEIIKEKRKDDPAVLAQLDKWQKALRAELNIPDSLFDQEKVLDLAAIIAQDVARPAVPVTGYLVGLAVGAAIERGEPVEAVIERVFGIAQDPQHLIGGSGPAT